jgi:hypothetical protein
MEATPAKATLEAELIVRAVDPQCVKAEELVSGGVTG